VGTAVTTQLLSVEEYKQIAQQAKGPLRFRNGPKFTRRIADYGFPGEVAAGTTAG
jgi:hypothetical protein